MSRRVGLTIGLVAIAAGFAIVPARAAFCGQPDDVNAIVKLTIATYPKVSHASPIDESSIRIVDVNGTYAYSVTEVSARRIPFYWEKPTGTWRFAAASHEPAGWFKPLLEFFEADDKAPAGSLHTCNNPHWKNH